MNLDPDDWVLRVTDLGKVFGPLHPSAISSTASATCPSRST